jgi:hypothetical protein
MDHRRSLVPQKVLTIEGEALEVILRGIQPLRLLLRRRGALRGRLP